jgi:hypothetical protein
MFYTIKKVHDVLDNPSYNILCTAQNEDIDIKNIKYGSQLWRGDKSYINKDK